MEREYLKGLGLEDEVIGKIMAEHGKTVQSLQSERDAATEEVATYKAQVEQRDNDIKELKESSTSKKDYDDKIAALEAKNAQDKQELESKLEQIKFDSKLTLSLKDADVRNPNAIKGLLELEDIKLKEDELEGLNEQLEALKESDGYLFNQPEDTAQITAAGNPTGKPGTETDVFAAAAQKFS